MTVKGVMKPVCWGTTAILLAASLLVRASRSSPSTRTVPASFLPMPAAAARRVLLPLPLGPRSARDYLAGGDLQVDLFEDLP